MLNDHELLMSNCDVHCNSIVLRAFAPLRELYFFVAILFALMTSVGARAESWDRFRGPNGAGQSDAASIPSEWQAGNYLWKRPLAGVGHSSPVIWDERVFVTSADEKTREQIVQAFDALSGEPRWERRFPSSMQSKHEFNSYASSTPALSEDGIFVMWCDGTQIKLLALTHDGEDMWQVDAGVSEEGRGHSASPVLIDDLIYVANDNEAFGELSAFDSNTGDLRWRIERPSGNTSFSTPCLLDPNAEEKILLMASHGAGLTAIDLSTRQVAWQAIKDELPARCVASTVVAAGLVFVSCGQGGSGTHMIAVRPPTETSDAHEVYRLKPGVSQVPTAVAAGDKLFMWQDKGIVSCIEVATGKVHWRERVGGNFHGSPVRIGDRILCASIEGEVVVLAAAPKFELLARNSLGEPTRATPAVAHDRLYIRTESSLMCIGAE